VVGMVPEMPGTALKTCSGAFGGAVSNPPPPPDFFPNQNQIFFQEHQDFFCVSFTSFF